MKKIKYQVTEKKPHVQRMSYNFPVFSSALDKNRNYIVSPFHTAFSALS